MQAWIAGMQVCKDAPDIRVDLNCSNSGWRDAIERLFELTGIPLALLQTNDAVDTADTENAARLNGYQSARARS
jgi:hypothetical protein